jgi:cytochrome c biogenesis protein CcmG, thiol:disulfide interchange protein DsbE
MGPRQTIAAGLAAGVLTAAVVLGGVIILGPAVAAPGVPTPSPASPGVATTRPTGSPAASGPGGSPAASGSASASGSAGPSAPGSGETTIFHIGEPAPTLVVPQVGGGTIDLAALKGKPVWINFMQTTCPPCIDEFPLMNGFAARYADEGLVVIAIDIREEEGLVAAFAQTLGATFPLGLDTDGVAQRAWGAYGLPVHYWIDRTGIVRDGGLGGIGPDIMARGVGAILPGVEVTP